jgi:hypothetical protein
LFGNDHYGKFAIFIIAALIIFGICRKQINLKLFLIAFVLLLLPLIPLGGATSPARYLFFIWWGITVLIAHLLSITCNKFNRYLFMLLSLVLIGISLKNSHEERHTLLDQIAPQISTYQFVLASNLNEVYVPPDFSGMLGYHLLAVIDAEKILFPFHPKRAKVAIDEEQLAALDLTKTSVWSYSTACSCIENITDRIPTIVSEYRSKLTEKPLSVNIRFEKHIFSWELGPYDDGEYAIILDDRGYFPLPKKGSFGYSMKPTNGYIRYTSPDGWLTQSPIFHLSHPGGLAWAWSRQAK